MKRVMKLAAGRAHQVLARRPERGYSLLAILAGLTISLIIIAAALPAIQHEMQRENEEEMFWRAEQMMFAIGMFRTMNGSYPTELEQLTRPQGPNGIHLIRPSAMIDPMTGKPWQAVRVADAQLIDFIHTIQDYLQGHPAEAALYPMTPAVRLPPRGTPMPPRGTSTGSMSLPPRGTPMPPRGTPTGTPNAPLPLNDPASSLLPEFPQLMLPGNLETGFSGNPSDTGLSPDGKSPIVGIVSRGKKKTIRNYYGIETYDRCIFVRAMLTGGNAWLGLRMPGQYAPPVRTWSLPQQGGSR